MQIDDTIFNVKSADYTFFGKIRYQSLRSPKLKTLIH